LPNLHHLILLAGPLRERIEVSRLRRQSEFASTYFNCALK
jgi:hypothetical protein